MKKAYTSPRLLVHGAVKDLTLQGPTNSQKDPNPCPEDKWTYYSCGPHS
jgi:hypothetical protein